MSRTYVIADLHGRLDLLRKAIERIEASPSGGTVVFLGDYVDRGPNSRGVLECLMGGPQSAHWKWVILSGNHDDWFANCAGPDGDREHEFHSWIEYGGVQTLLSYGHPRVAYRHMLNPPAYVPKTHLQWIKTLPFIHEDEHRVYVHGGIDTALPIIEQKKEVVHWYRWGRGERNEAYFGKHIVHGHTPNEHGPELRSNRTNLDTLAWYTGRLAVGVFDDDTPGGPVEVWEIRE